MKLTISREESIPFVDQDWIIMQMIRKKVFVSVTWEEWETEEQIKEKLDKLFEEEFDKALASDDIYQKQKKQLKFLLDELKKHLPKEKVKDIILKAKKL